MLSTGLEHLVRNLLGVTTTTVMLLLKLIKVNYHPIFSNTHTQTEKKYIQLWMENLFIHKLSPILEQTG